MVVEKGTVFSVRIPAKLEKSIDAVSARGGLTSLDWIRAVLALQVHEGAFGSIAPSDDPGIEDSRVTPLRVTSRLKTFVDRAAEKSGAKTQSWTRAVLARAANEGAFAPRKGDRHGSKPKRKPTP
jgi:hypothetical protein